MEFDWLDAPFAFDLLKPKEIEESFEDPFSQRLLPEVSDGNSEARFISLGRDMSGRGIFSVFRTDGKNYRVILARPMTPEEDQFYERKNTENNN